MHVEPTMIHARTTHYDTRTQKILNERACICAWPVLPSAVDPYAVSIRRSFVAILPQLLLRALTCILSLINSPVKTCGTLCMCLICSQVLLLTLPSQCTPSSSQNEEQLQLATAVFAGNTGLSVQLMCEAATCSEVAFSRSAMTTVLYC